MSFLKTSALSCSTPSTERQSLAPAPPPTVLDIGSQSVPSLRPINRWAFWMSQASLATCGSIRRPLLKNPESVLRSIAWHNSLGILHDPWTGPIRESPPRCVVAACSTLGCTRFPHLTIGHRVVTNRGKKRESSPASG